MNELKKNRGAMLRRMLVAFARDAEADPAEVAAAAGMIADLEEARPGTEAPVPAEPAREPETESADACRANSEDTEPAGIGALIAKADELLTGLVALTEALTNALTSRAADEDGEEPDREPGASDPAAEAERLLEAALAEDTEEPDEAAGAEEEGLLSDEDEPGEAPVPAGDPAMAGMIRELMPVVAALPEETRREAADALLRAARKNAGLPPRAAAAPYAALRARKASDRLADPEALGRRIMATRNINMKKRA